jgi:hypothetical protein
LPSICEITILFARGLSDTSISSRAVVGSNAVKQARYSPSRFVKHSGEPPICWIQICGAVLPSIRDIRNQACVGREPSESLVRDVAQPANQLRQRSRERRA